MKSSSFKYLLKEGVRNLWHNRVMAFTSIGVLTTCLLIVGTAYLITKNVDQMIGVVEGQNEMSVILLDMEDEQIKQIENQIKAMEDVKSVEYISKEQGLEKTKEMLGEDGYLLDGIKDRNTIPPKFVIKVKDLKRTAYIKSSIEDIEGVEMVLASKGVIDTLTYIQRTISTLGTAIIAALAVISLVIINNTIRATIFTRRKEINIMKFVGATNSFIRIPFIVEGFLLGLISALVSFSIIWGAYSYIVKAFSLDTTAWLSSLFSSIIPFNDIALDLAAFFAATGIILGTIGSAISIRNHAKV